MPGRASTAGSAAGMSARVRRRRASVVTLPSPPAPTAAMRDRGSETIAMAAATAAVPRRARRRAGDAGHVTVERSTDLGELLGGGESNTDVHTAESISV